MQLFNPIQPLKDAFISRLANEYEAHIFYRNLANWCNNKGYKNAQAYFEAEAASELTHAEKLQAFLNNWGVVYSLPSVSVTDTFDSLPDGIKKAYDIEAALYQAYTSNVNEAENVDRSAYILLLDMVQVQYEAVAEYRTFIDQLETINELDPFQVFMWEKEVFE